jgi:hypothetical protein
MQMKVLVFDTGEGVGIDAEGAVASSDADVESTSW